MKIVFLGTPRLAQIVLENLANSPFKPQLVITGQNNKAGRGLALSASLVKQEAVKHHIAVDYELAAIDKSFDLAILVAFGRIIPKEILEKPKHGFINVHPSLLPKYRGPSPIQSAILDGEKKTGVTIIKLDQEVDHGAILNQQEIEIENQDTHESLIEKTGMIGSNLLIETLPNYLKGKIKPEEQNHKTATFTKKITKTNGQIDLNNPPSKQKLQRMINAYYPWPTVWTEVETRNQKPASQAKRGEPETRNLRIKFLPKGLIQPEGKRPMSVNEVKNGFPQIYERIKHFIGTA
ncbi:methionyl-tRNA formyltransferase [Candidatus Curtissbacteria bacterium RIFCSPLOWO2_02_FULL_40_11]|uniref:Methionyl-tRNA formyltransferase n=2 Tax=Candidatus Curtissiibacteriota TaxID=1752717 RepID=A0A1F5G6H5_9BACT|nr:MAG: methionyl-tRNA formyltransferase [Candidatus Curtissbacteria bacterium RIFCSPHIGHO2_02_FULL_40_16b]OGD99542.1 MAG: methionyl-tRNA formyltransferase [Candidatus Curtissbacteria bacterium RIFCSPLOWO2_02_FULL_40_11]OGE12644.1 MAG: methionyl-tRNA formyltransferase [Candidatus Curtissbacteria bacterium RIFCSPLOWO2_12_FULL_38_9]